MNFNCLSGLTAQPKRLRVQQKIPRFPRSPGDSGNGAESEPTNENPGAEPEGVAPESEPEVKNQSEPEPESSDSNSAAWPETEPETWPEAGPRWREAFEIWGVGWPLHIYLFGTLFLLIGLYGGYYVLVNVYDGLAGKFLSVSLNLMALLFGLTRAFVLYLDPYHQGGFIDAVIPMRVVWSVGGPCLLAADSAIILALVELAHVSIAPPRLQKLRTVAIIVAIHFSFVVLTDWVVSSYMDAKAMLLFCQVFFIFWGSLLGTGYIRLALVLNRELFQRKAKDKADRIYLALIYLSGAANYFVCGIVLYSAFSVFGVYADVDYVDAWHWWVYQTLSRLSEVITCVLIFTVSAKRSRVECTSDAQHVNPIAPSHKQAWNDTASQRNEAWKDTATQGNEAWKDTANQRNEASSVGNLFKSDEQSCKRSTRSISSFVRRFVRRHCDSRVAPDPTSAAKEPFCVKSDSIAYSEPISSPSNLQSEDCMFLSAGVGEPKRNTKNGTGEIRIEGTGSGCGELAVRPRSGRRLSMFSALHTQRVTSGKEMELRDASTHSERVRPILTVLESTGNENFKTGTIPSKSERPTILPPGSTLKHYGSIAVSTDSRERAGPEQNNRELDSNGNTRLFPNLEETDESSLTTSIQPAPIPARRNSLFSALQDAKDDVFQAGLTGFRD